MTEPKITPMTLLDEGIHRCEDLFGPPGGNTPIGLKTQVEPGSLLCLVLGDNASGKSMLRKLLTEVGRKHEPRIGSIHTSMSARCSSGIARLAMYGSEDDDSTGYNSAHTVEGAIRTSRQRAEPHILIFDEPDTGLSDRWARSAGREIAALLRDPPASLVAVFLITHRRPLVEELLPLRPSAVLVGHEWPTSLQDWVAGDTRDVPSLAELHDEGFRRWQAIEGVFKSRKRTP